MNGVRTCRAAQVCARTTHSTLTVHSQYTHSTRRACAVPRCRVCGPWLGLGLGLGLGSTRPCVDAHLCDGRGQVVRGEEEAVGGVALHVGKVRMFARKGLHAPLELVVRALSRARLTRVSGRTAWVLLV